MLKNINLIKGISFLLLASFLSFNVIADEAVAQETEVNSLAIEEIIVTARKKGRIYSRRSDGGYSYY